MLARPHIVSTWFPATALLVSASAAPLAASADELGAAGNARGIVVHDSETVLRERCVTDEDGRLWFVLPGGNRYELITSTDDPEITNPGDGSFHVFDAVVVRDALAQVSFPLDRVDADIYLLPYPRRGHLDSAAGIEIILLSPGVRPLSREHQHAEVAHEIGHVVQYAHLPDVDTARWTVYRGLRGIQDLGVYFQGARHQDRPHEIFAEDFRVLFGGADAAGSGAVENSTLVPPAQVPGLRDFMLGLAGGSGVVRLAASPNPARGTIRLSQPSGASVALDWFDVRGRRITSWTPRRIGSSVEWVGDLSGFAVPGGRVLFARPRSLDAPATRVVVLP